MATILSADQPFALVTVYAADGGPRGSGAQMVVTDADSWGYVSGGCIEADVAIHGRRTLEDGEPRRLVYGKGSPWIDTRLPCGGRLDLLVERISPDDAVIRHLVAAYSERRCVRYQSDGVRRNCTPVDEGGEGDWIVDEAFWPVQRVVVFGSDPIALAIGSLAGQLGWSSVIVWPDGPVESPSPQVSHRRDGPASALRAIAPDAQTAIAVATHDLEYDEQAILAALASEAGYIGVLGARRRIPDRLDRLRAQGIAESAIARLHMPIGLPIAATTPWEIAVSVAAQIVQQRHAPANRS